MNYTPLHGMRTFLLSLVALSFAGCASLQSAMPAGLGDMLGQVTGMSDSISGWKSTLGGALDATGLGQLQQYADKAGSIGKSIEGMKSGLSDAMANPMGAIGSKLKDMSGLDVDSLRNLAPDAQMKAVGAFSDSAGGVSDLAKGFLDKFGS